MCVEHKRFITDELGEVALLLSEADMSHLMNKMTGGSWSPATSAEPTATGCS
jgi:hypothetical protein